MEQVFKKPVHIQGQVTTLTSLPRKWIKEHNVKRYVKMTITEDNKLIFEAIGE